MFTLRTCVLRSKTIVWSYSEHAASRPIRQMAKSRYEYVKGFESDSTLLPNCWIVVRVDGRSFHKFAEAHRFAQPNDARGLHLMNRAAAHVMHEFKDVVLAFGESDEYSLVLRKNTLLYNRRSQKILSYVNSLFSAAYVFYWPDYFDGEPLQRPPLFDGRVVLYPTDANLRDYLSWRQADVHVNNLYNTAFWALVNRRGLSRRQANERLAGTLAADKNELLFAEFNINYNDEPAMFRKGTVLLRKKVQHRSLRKPQLAVVPLHQDLIRDQFWLEHGEVLTAGPPATYAWPDDQPLPDLVLDQIKQYIVDANT